MESSGAGEKNNINPRPSDSALDNGLESGHIDATKSNSEIESRVHSQIVEIVHRSPELTQDDVSNMADLLKQLIRFDRIDAEAVRSVPGTGLGLYVARNIVRQHSGELAVVPGSTSGSTLQVTLPVTTDK